MSYTKQIKLPKNVHEGTKNRVQLIINEIEGGDPTEAVLQCVDLLDSLEAQLVVTERVPPLNHAAVQQMKAEEYRNGFTDGFKAGIERARRDLIAELRKTLENLPVETSDPTRKPCLQN